MKTLVLSGDKLSLENLVGFARRLRGDVSLQFSPGVEKRVAAAAEWIAGKVKKGDAVYGVTTGFGSNQDKLISAAEAEELQRNLILSHAVGYGPDLPEDIVRGALALRANTLLQGRSGVTMETLRFFADMLNSGAYPAVPAKGSLGASGDLAPLSHMVLPMLGYGYVYMNGRKTPASEWLEKTGRKPHKLTYKEGLALNNGTPVMTAVGAFALYDAMKLYSYANMAAALTMEALLARSSSLDPLAHALRTGKKSDGQEKTARRITALLNGSKLIDFPFTGAKNADKSTPCPGNRREIVQNAYSIRCVPQVHGAVANAINHVKDVVEMELNAVTDNPLIFPEHDKVISAGNFHGEPLALPLEYLKVAVAELGSISERRLYKLTDKTLNEGLPAYLSQGKSGLNSGIMIVQYVAASLVSENKVLAHPAAVDSIPTSENFEDHVSMGSITAYHALQIADNTSRIIASELFAAFQGVSVRLQQLGKSCDDFSILGAGTAAIMQTLREAGIRPYATDEWFYEPLNVISELLRGEKLLNAVDAALKG